MPSCYHQGLDKTEKSNFAGGDTNWEERRQLTYATRYGVGVATINLLILSIISEVRLVEILDRICSSSDYHVRPHPY